MSNPFIEISSPVVEQRRRRARQFQMGVYAVLSAMTVFLLAMLIQGCRAESSEASGKVVVPESGAPTVAATDAPSLEPTTNVVETSASITPAEVPTSPVVTSVPAVATNLTEVKVPSLVAEVSETYTVKAGDTLTRIAAQHATSVRALKTLNHLKTDRIAIGQKLKVPHPEGTTPPA